MMAVVSVMASCQSDPYVVKTANGPVRGFDEEGTMAFKGIPYAHAERCMPPAVILTWRACRSGIPTLSKMVSAICSALKSRSGTTLTVNSRRS